MLSPLMKQASLKSSAMMSRSPCVQMSRPGKVRDAAQTEVADDEMLLEAALGCLIDSTLRIRSLPWPSQGFRGGASSVHVAPAALASAQVQEAP